MAALSFTEPIASSSNADPAPLDFFEERVNQVDPEDAMMASHSLKRAAMLKSSTVKEDFEKSRAEALFAKNMPITRRQMMPTDLEKWSKDERRQEAKAANQQRHESAAKDEIREFVEGQGALIQRIGFERAIGITQDQALIGDSDSYNLLIGLLRPMTEKAKMSEAFQALELHVQESASLLQHTLETSQRELDHSTHHAWTRDVEASLPSTEEFQHVVSPPEQQQLAIHPTQIVQIVSGFNIYEASHWQIPDRTPNMDSSDQFIASAPPVPKPAPVTLPLPEETLLQLESVHENLMKPGKPSLSSQQPELATSGGYYSAEDD